MNVKLRSWSQWIWHRPVALINIIGLLLIVVGGLSYIAYQSLRPLDVLQDWTIAVSEPKEYKVVNGTRYPVYHPNESLVFTSKSIKLIDAQGTTSRFILCKATDTQPEREIQLDAIPATRPAGVNVARENAIVVPDVSQFEGLPRFCRLVIDINYEAIALGRSHSEHSETDDFLVEEQKLDPTAIRNQIKDLNARITDLENQLSSFAQAEDAADTPPATAPKASTSPQATTGINNGSKSAPGAGSAPQATKKFQLRDIPVAGGLFKAIGL